MGSPKPRYSQADALKYDGATYTPISLAHFVAKQILQTAKLPTLGKIRILDPAVGSGILLDELIKQLPPSVRGRLDVTGYDTNGEALALASTRLQTYYPKIHLHMVQRNFLEHFLTQVCADDLFSTESKEDPFHLIIANPPYVRTQVLGARLAQQISKSFGLNGRVDLYYPFLLGISRLLDPVGVAGIITSNRFMTTKSGQAVRRDLLERFQICHVWDLGDTKLFDAAVLPSVIVARRKKPITTSERETINYSSIYQTSAATDALTNDALSALSEKDGTVVAVADGRRFIVRHGLLDHSGKSGAVWRIGTVATDKWLATVEANTWATFRRIGKIRVGVKSTADKVFIRSDWDSIPEGRPELLRPLVTRHSGRRFKGLDAQDMKRVKEILYPHEASERGRRAVDLGKYPKTANYLERHRGTLEARTYVIDTGRKWYELWVPQDPAAWSSPKLVFPDIAEKPLFWIDKAGAVVNGECYWLRCDNEKEEYLLWLALAVANSTFIEEFYDHRFNNKLYGGRRRYITQYVEQFPLPDPTLESSQAIIEMAKDIYNKLPSIEADRIAQRMDKLVWKLFGLTRKEVSG